MGLTKPAVLLCSLLIATPALSMLPMPMPPEMQQQQQQQQQQPLQQPPQPTPQQQPLQQQIIMQQQMLKQQLAQQGQGQAPTPITPKVDFDFNGFFDYFVKIYGKHALLSFEDRLKQRKIAEGMSTSAVPGLPIPCLLAPAYQGAVVKYGSPSRVHGSIATYECDTGYQGTGAVIMCTSGTWSEPGVNVTCSQMHCGPTHTMAHAQVTRTGDTVGSTATYTCDPGYQADNIASPIRCQADGTWSQPSFHCTNMMASNQAMSQMAQMRNMMGSMGGMGGMSGMMQQAMGGAGGMGGQGNNMMAALSQAMGGGASPGGVGGNPMSAMMSSMMGGQQSSPQALPPHLASLGSIAPMLMPSLMGGATAGMGQRAGATGMPGMPGATPGKPLEPEQQQEQMMMRMLMQNMYMQNQRKQAMMLQRRRQAEHKRQMMLKEQRKRQLELQEQQRLQREQQEQAQKNSVNLSNILAMAGNAGSNPEASVLQKLTAAGGSGDLVKALQTLATLAKVMNQQDGSTTDPQSGAASSSPSPGSTNSQNTASSSVFNSGGSSSPSSSTSSGTAPQSPTSSQPSSAGGDVRAAIMAAGLQSRG